MSFDQDIADINNLYPADAPGVAGEVGRELLQQAREEVVTYWQHESEEVIARYAQLCRERAGV
ncbi:MAG: hypothetical protein CMN80_14520 [Spongiibacter sp.]|uniref:hypothetical protein n=1 Tax=Spongiibacter sp. TaxID=2024860 RepID=UPI000C0B7286|nr:hypothetical protein [Spongiibacter sp.]MAK45351.1 hypothetical protein [Spongiibacter sp.]